MPDSIADSIARPAMQAAFTPGSEPDAVLRMPRESAPRPFDADLTHALNAMVEQEPLDMSAFESIVESASAPPAWTGGMEPEPRMMNPAGHSLVLGLLSLLFIACILAYSRFSRTIGSIAQQMWSVRRRQNAFDESSPGRRRVQLLLAIQLAAYSGVLLYAFFSPGPVADSARSLADTLRLMGVAGAYYVFQLCAYSTVGYAFAPDRSGASQWLGGFNASQGLAGMALALPTLGIVFYPSAATAMLWAAAAIYVTARLIFIIKGFKIFYNGFISLIYFILYLCTLEIVPLICIGGIALGIVGRQ